MDTTEVVAALQEHNHLKAKMNLSLICKVEEIKRTKSVVGVMEYFVKEHSVEETCAIIDLLNDDDKMTIKGAISIESRLENDFAQKVLNRLKELKIY